jgi:vacuolar-type H+-ATPase subunit I/STV1
VGIISKEINTKSEKITELYKRLKWDIKRLNKAAKKYYNQKKFKGPILKKKNKVYLL